MAMRGLMDEPQGGFFGGLQNAFTNPLTLGGLGLLSGGGFDGAMQGMRTGAGFQEQQRQLAEQQRQRRGFNSALDGLGNTLTPELIALARAQGPSAMPEVFKYLMDQRDPAKQLDMDYRRAQIAKLQREAAMGGEQPSNVREWMYFNKLSPEEQQRYLTMKRAEKYLDTGTAFVQPNPVNPGEAVRTVPKDIAGKEAAEVQGKAQAEAELAMPGARASLARVRKQIDALKSDPYLPNMLGPVNSLKPNMTTDAARVQGMINQLRGGAFLEARQLLKGGGAITDFEGQKAEQAFLRAQEAQSVKDFVAALEDFYDAVDAGVQKLEAQARGGQGQVITLPDGWSIRQLDGE